MKPVPLKAWIEAMRLRTLPVSLAGVVAALAYGRLCGAVNIAVFLLCLVFAVLAQIASNFGNEYYDFKRGFDKVGRDGPRRGVTEGDITPQAMKTATFVTLALACLVGLSLVFWGGWWLIVAGIMIALGVLAYSTGPFPLSHHGLGEIAVIFFFGIVPVNLTFYVMSGYFDTSVFLGSLSIGLMGANVLLVNNIRDVDDDRSVGKHTLVVLTGRRFAALVYLLNGWLAAYLMGSVWYVIGSFIVPGAYIVLHTLLWYVLTRRSGRALNPLLGMTACLMFAYALAFLLSARTPLGRASYNRGAG
ncbi:MAG: 1,4-dihydroxy-2-naphthoate octaprenyltransferase, partial [Muribaculaceae bacterium]|nr:1,4-dihydroxy-2-naphthoate octaprenyltransferase [Muribaculaceae bacterium]